MKITVFGATGMLGSPVTRQLVDQGFEVTCMVRDTAKAKQLLPSTVNLVQGDLLNEPDIEKALKGSEAVYISLSVVPNSRMKQFQPEREGIENILEAAYKHQIKVIGYCSSIVQQFRKGVGSYWWVFDIKNDAVGHIKQVGIPYLIFFASNFMENFSIGKYRQGKRINLAGRSRHPMYWISAEDYARQVVKAFQSFKGESKEYFMQGPEPFNSDEAAHVFVDNYAKEKLSVAKVPVGVLKFFGNFSATLNYGAHIVEALNNYPEKFKAESTWKELGKPEVTLAQFAQRL